MSGHVDVLPTLADICGLAVSRDVAEQLEGGSLVPVLKNAEARLDEGRMQVHHVGRWPDPHTWREQKYAKLMEEMYSYLSFLNRNHTPFSFSALRD